MWLAVCVTGSVGPCVAGHGNNVLDKGQTRSGVVLSMQLASSAHVWSATGGGVLLMQPP